MSDAQKSMYIMETGAPQAVMIALQLPARLFRYHPNKYTLFRLYQSRAVGNRDCFIVGSFAALSSSLAFFFVFGLGFGWPLALLPFLAAPFQRRFTGWMTRNYSLLTRVSGALLVAIGLFGVYADLLPQL